MAVTATSYGVFYIDLLNGVHIFPTDTDKVALLAGSYTPDFAAHIAFSDVAAFEVTGTGYTRGGIALTGKEITYDPISKTCIVTADLVSWVTLTATCRYALVYQSTGINATSKLIGLIDFGGDRSYTAEPLQLSFPGGVVSIAAGS